MSGRKATTNIIPGRLALSVGKPEKKIPKGWSWTLLTDVATLATGHTPSRKKSEYWDGEIPWMAVGDARKYNGKEIFHTKEYTNHLGIKNSAAVLLPKDTVCLSRTASIGYSVILGKEMATSQGFVNWVCSDLLHPRFLQLLFLAENQFLHEISEGTAHTTIYFPEVKAFNIALPPRPEQDRIVAKLDKLFEQLDTIKESLEKIPVLLKNFRQQVLTQAVTGKLTEEWRKDKSIKEPIKKRLGDLGKWKGGGTPSKSNQAFWQNGKVLWITPKDMKDLFLSTSQDKITEDAVSNSSAILLPKNSILMVTRSGILRRIFPVSTNTIETTVNQDLKALIPNEDVYFKFLLYSLRGLESDIRNTCMKGGTTVESIDFTSLKNYIISVPFLEEQKEIVCRVEGLFEKAEAIEQQYHSLKSKVENLPQSILQKAFKGELVPQLESDGNARELLEEMKNSAENLVQKVSARRKKMQEFSNKFSGQYPEEHEDMNTAAESEPDYSKKN